MRHREGGLTMKFRSVPMLDEGCKPQGCQTNIEDSVRATWRERFEDVRREVDRLTKLRAIDLERIEELTKELIAARMNEIKQN
jgi:hypothetical protein